MENLRFRHGMWLVNTLLNYKKLNREELNKLWVHNVDLSGGEELTRNQLNRAISSALDVLGVSIECDVKDRYRYYISGDNSMKATELMLSSFSIKHLMTEEGNLRERILLEEVPSGQFFLPTIIEAMSKGKAMELDYKKFSDSEPYTCFIEPYCVKLSQQRWYLLARKNHSSHLQLFALDRMQQLRILEDVDFKIPEYFSSKDYFAPYFGIYHKISPVIETIQIKVNLFWRSYFRTLPLHPSQQEIETHADYSVFEYKLAVTPDLTNKFLEYGSSIEVLAPKSLREQMRDLTAQMASLYQ